MDRAIPRLLILTAALLAVTAGGPACADWLYDGYPIYNRGIAIGKDRPTEMVAQPFSLPWDCRIDRLCAAVARGADPNQAGIRVMLALDPRDVAKTTLASWRIFPVSGPTLASVYWDIKPLRIDAGRTYYLVFAPGDSEFMGTVAYASRGNPALATNDGGTNWFDIAQLGVRIGGTVVPEPSGLLMLAAGVSGVRCWVLGKRRARRRSALP